MHESLGWIPPTYTYAQWIHVNVELLILVVVEGLVGTTKLRSAENFEWPELASQGFHVLKTAEPLVEVLAEEDACAVVSSF